MSQYRTTNHWDMLLLKIFPYEGFPITLDELSAAHRACFNSPEPWQVCVWPVVTKEEESKVLR